MDETAGVTELQEGNGALPGLAQKGIDSLEELEDSRSTFARLRGIAWEFRNDVTSYLSHDLHPYPAKFIPQIPANLIAQLSVRGELIWDPFGGSGTAAVEAVLLGRRAVSSDANPLATVIGRAKTTTLSLDEEVSLHSLATELSLSARDGTGCERLLEEMRGNWESKVPPIPNIEKWFSSLTVRELAYLRYVIEQIPSQAQKDVAMIALSRCVQKTSFQDSETRYSSKPRTVKLGEALSVFARELTACANRVSRFGRLMGFRTARFVTHNAMSPIWVGTPDLDITEDSVDLVVTSPPYPNVTDYHLYHRFRMFWLGFDPRDFGRVEIGSHLRNQREGSEFKHYLKEMSECLRNIYVALRPGRYAAIVIGDGLFAGQLYSTAREIGGVASDIGFALIGMLGRAIHNTKRSFAVPARRARHEQILILRKRGSPRRFTLSPPNYKLHGYERVLRKYEIESFAKASDGQDSDELTLAANAVKAPNLRRLVFSHTFRAREFATEKTWQALLENGIEQPRRKKQSNYWLHGVHPYKGKFYPQLAASLINISRVPSGGCLLDPYCGSGTAVTEGTMRGYESFGCDINPLAVKIARVKTRLLCVSPTLIDHAFSQLLSKLPRLDVSQTATNAWLENHTPTAKAELMRWFPAPVLAKIGALYREFLLVPSADIQELFEVILSGLIREISQQDPKDLRIRLRKTRIEDADVIGLFSKELEEKKRKIIQFFRIANAAPARLGSGLIWEGNSRMHETFVGKLESRSVDLIISSPPYATALPYIDTYRLSHLVLLGAPAAERRPLEQALTGSREIGGSSRKLYEDKIEAQAFDPITSSVARNIISVVYANNKNAEVGFRRQNQASLLYRYFEDISVTMTTLDSLLAKRAQMFFVLGNSVTVAGRKEVEIDTVGAVRQIGSSLGWRLKREIPISVTTENLKHQKNAITSNSILWFER